MPTFRHFVTVGVAIALSFIEPDASKKLPSLIHRTSDKADGREVQPAVSSTPKRLTVPSASDEEVRSPASKGDKPAPTSGDSKVVPSISPSSLAPQEAVEQAKAVGQSKPVVTVSNVVVEAGAEGSSPAKSNTATLSVDAPQSKSIVTPTPDTVKPTQQEVNNPVLSLGDAVIQLATSTLGTLQNLPSKAGEDTGKPFSPLGNDIVVQSPSPVTPQPPSGNQGTPAPEFLNPSANPLLFPTQTEEVQIQTTQPITLQQALELARLNNRDFEAQKLVLERNQAALREALSAEFPTASLNLDYTRQDSASTRINNEARARVNAAPQDPTSTAFNGSVQLNYDLFTAGRRPAQIRAAEEQVRFQQLEIERISEQLRLDVTNAYYDLQEADALVEIEQAAVADAAQSLREAQLLEQAGLGTRFDVLQSQVQLARANQRLTSQISQQRIARRRIVELLSLAQPVDVTAADPIEVAGEWNLSMEQSIVLAYKNRAELEQQLVQRDINEQRRRIELAATLPQAGLTASYNLLGVLNDELGPQDALTLGANLRWNFFDAGATRARVAQQRTNIAIAETQFASQRNQVRREVEQAFFNLNANARNIQTTSFALVQAQESLRLARLRFQAGVGTQTDVINQQTELTRTRVERLSAILNYNRSLAALQRGVSNLPDSNLFDLP
jgi:outer membrane protein TolC